MLMNFPPFTTNGPSVTLPDHDGESAMVVACPECGGDYTYMLDNWTGNQGGLHLYFEGECGHTFTIIMEFHKGNTFVRVEEGNV